MLDGKEEEEEEESKKNKIEMFAFDFHDCEKSRDFEAIFYIRITKGFHP